MNFQFNCFCQHLETKHTLEIHKDFTTYFMDDHCCPFLSEFYDETCCYNVDIFMVYTRWRKNTLKLLSNLSRKHGVVNVVPICHPQSPSASPSSSQPV